MSDTPVRPALRLITDTIIEEEPGRLELGEGFDIEPPDLAARYPLDIDHNNEGEVIA